MTLEGRPFRPVRSGRSRNHNDICWNHHVGSRASEWQRRSFPHPALQASSSSADELDFPVFPTVCLLFIGEGSVAYWSVWRIWLVQWPTLYRNRGDFEEWYSWGSEKGPGTCSSHCQIMLDSSGSRYHPAVLHSESTCGRSVPNFCSDVRLPLLVLRLVPQRRWREGQHFPTVKAGWYCAIGEISRHIICQISDGVVGKSRYACAKNVVKKAI
jgi:hypothetical protein